MALVPSTAVRSYVNQLVKNKQTPAPTRQNQSNIDDTQRNAVQKVATPKPTVFTPYLPPNPPKRTSNNLLKSIATPPNNVFTPYLPPNPPKTPTPQPKPGGGGGGGGGGMTTIYLPTPSAETLKGTPQQIEQQIQQYRTNQMTTAYQLQQYGRTANIYQQGVSPNAMQQFSSAKAVNPFSGFFLSTPFSNIGGLKGFNNNFQVDYKTSDWEKAKDIFYSFPNIVGFNPVTKYGEVDFKIKPEQGEEYFKNVNQINMEGVRSNIIGIPAWSTVTSGFKNYFYIEGLRKSAGSERRTEEKKLGAFGRMLNFTETNFNAGKISEEEYNIGIKQSFDFAKSTGLNVTAITTTKETEINPGYSFMDTSGKGWQVSPEIRIDTNTSYNLTPKNWVSPNIAMRSYLKESGASGLKQFEYAAGSIGAKTFKGVEVGLLTYGAMEGLAIPALIEYGAVGIPARFGAAGSIGTGIIKYGTMGAIGGLSAYNIASQTYTGIKESSMVGLSGWKGGVIGGLGGVGETAGFFIGGSGGKLSPVQMQPIITNEKTGLTTTWSLGVVNPFGKSGVPLTTWTEGKGFNLGGVKAGNIMGQEFQASNQLSLRALKDFSKIAVNRKQAEDLYSLSESILPKTYKLTSPKGEAEVNLKQIRYWKEFKPETQKLFQQEFKGLGESSSQFTWKGFGRTFKENVLGGRFSSSEFKGLERGFGSLFIRAEKGIGRTVGDIDISFYGRAIPKIKGFGARLEKTMPGRFKVDQGHIYFKGSKGWDKLIESFGKDIPSAYQSPLGYKSQYPISMKLKGGADIAGQRLGESYVQKFATLLTVKVSPFGKVTIGAREGQEKVVPDIYRMTLRLGELSKKNKGNILASAREYKSLIGKSYGKINWNTGTFKTNINMERMATVPASSFGYFAAKTTSKASKNQKSMFDISKVSKLSMPQFSLSLSKSSSSKSSLLSGLSSFSSSAKSGLSSFSSSSKSSLSSLSSLSSSSTSSYSSSSYSSSSSFFSRGVFFPGIQGFGFGEGGSKKKKKGKRKKGKILPSFTAQVFNIVGKLPKSKGYGITPFQIRKIPFKGGGF